MKSKAVAVLSRFWNKGNTKEKTAALVVLGIFVIIYLAIPWQVPAAAMKNAPLGMSPRFFPYLISYAGLIMSFIVVVRSFFSAKGPPEGGEGVFGVRQVKRAGPVVVFAVAYLFLFNVLGYMLSAILCFSLLLWYYGVSFRKEWAVVVPIIILLPVILYLVFKYQLYVSLPSGILPELPF